MTTQVEMKSHKRSNTKCKALLDTGSTVTLVSENLVQKLNLSKTRCSLSIEGMNHSSSSVTFQTEITFKSL